MLAEQKQRQQKPHKQTQIPHLISAPANIDFLKKSRGSQGFILLSSSPSLQQSLALHCLRSRAQQSGTLGKQKSSSLALACLSLPDPLLPSPWCFSSHDTFQSCCLSFLSPLAEPLLWKYFCCLASVCKCQLDSQRILSPRTVWLALVPWLGLVVAVCSCPRKQSAV